MSIRFMKGSGQAVCKICHKKIAKGDVQLIVGIGDNAVTGPRIHASCMKNACEKALKDTNVSQIKSFSRENDLIIK